MTSPRSLRTFAGVLVVVLVLLTIWSAYNLYSDARAASTPTARTVASYSGVGQGEFVASLLPNELCNCTQITGGNTTLFSSITQWVNVSLESSITLSTPGTISLVDRFGVILSTLEWTKTLYSTINESGPVDGTSAMAQDHYSINVSALENLTKQIDQQLDYTNPEAILTISESVEGTVSVGGVSGIATVAPLVSFTFDTATLSSGILQPTSEGVLQTTEGTDGPIPWSAYVLVVAASGTLLAALGWYLTLSPRAGTEEETLPDMEDLIAPYEEVIAETRTAPDPAMIVSIERWKDLVKISDTLGKPILRPMARPPSAKRTSFYVIDGDVGYLYRYHSGEPTPNRGEQGTVNPTTSADLLERVRTVADRTAALPADDPRYRNAVARFRRVQALLQAHRWPEAEKALSELEGFLGSA
jgi:Family of unknown function (DUF5305)